MSRTLAIRAIRGVTAILVVPLALVGVVAGPLAAGSTVGTTGLPIKDPLFVTQAGTFGPGQGWAVNGLAFYVTFDNGRSWRDITPPYVAAMGDPMARLAGFDAMGKEDYWFAAEDVILPGPSVNGSLRGSVVEFTTDGGHRWGASQQLRTGSGIEMSMVTTKVGYLLGGPDLYETTDGGARWEVVGRAPAQGPGGTIELMFADRQDGWAVESGSLYRTTNAGRSWRSVPLPVPAPYRDLGRTISAPRFFTPNDGVLTSAFLRHSGRHPANRRLPNSRFGQGLGRRASPS